MARRIKSQPRKSAAVLIRVPEELKEECSRIGARDGEPLSVVLRRLIRLGLSVDRENARA
jgi:hypothetical protein